MNELTYLTESEKVEVLVEAIPEIGRLQGEIKLAKEKVIQLNKDEAELLKYREQLTKDIE